jgi:hypothetical protein
MAVVIFLMAQAVLAFGADFAGEWRGEWRNSLGESGPDSLVLSEDYQGNLSGLWTNEVRVTGRRLNPNTIELQGQTSNRSYQITATVEHGEMHLRYMATRLDGAGSYRGRARLFRAR